MRMVRDASLHAGRLRWMTIRSGIGAIIYPPVPKLHGRPCSVHEFPDPKVGRALDLFDIDVGVVLRWRVCSPPGTP
jgi:4-hydroxy-3-polyprenylbenzoate decarboxylase